MTDDIDIKLASLGDWRGDLLARIKSVIKTADPDVEEAVKWRKPTNPLGVPTWSHSGIICTGESYKDKVKLTFMNGGALPDPHRLFIDSKGVRRAIDIYQHDVLDVEALATLVKAAVAHNLARG